MELFQALQENDVLKVKKILTLHPSLVNRENEDGLLPLGVAAHFGNKEIVQVLLEYGAEVNAISQSKVTFIPSNTALHAAIAGERNLEVIKLLLESQVDPTIFDSNGHTSLHTAAFHDNNIEIIDLLLAYGADVNKKVEDGKTALELAVEQGHHQVAEQLREKMEK